MGYKKPNNISRHDIHPLDPFFYYIGSRWVMISLWIASVAAGAILSLRLEDWTWLTRFGAISTMTGTLLTLSPLFRGGIYLSNAETFGFAALDEEKQPMSTSHEIRSTSINIVIGVILIIISTIINAFGDYIVGLIQ